MSDSYLSVKCRCQSEMVINKSRFITTLIPITDADDAFEQIKAINKQYSDATHNCYAFISNKTATEQRFSDDGEPQGTAGIPMLEVLKKRNYRMILAVVTRYFGGIKLGAGGLVSAYSGCVSDALDKAVSVCFVYAKLCSVRCEYTVFKKINELIERYGEIISVEYDDGVTIEFATDSNCFEELSNKIIDLSQGRSECKIKSEEYFGFKK